MKDSSKNFMLHACIFLLNENAVVVKEILDVNDIPNNYISENILEVEDSEGWEKVLKRHNILWKYIT